jgi:GTP-binding protein LepA
MTVKGELLVVDNPTNLPPTTSIEYMEEPITDCTIMTPDEYVGAVMDICQEKRGVFKKMEYIEDFFKGMKEKFGAQVQ